MIERNVIDRIFETTRIVDVVEDFVSLKRRGANFVGCCPFHNERTPSFMVSPAKNIYKCFGCGKAGNAVNFVMEHEQLGYPDALRYLAKKYGIEIVEKEQTPEERLLNDRRESLMVVSAYAARMFQENLHENREGQAIGLSYFKERGFRDDTIKKFELGYCLETRDAFSKKAVKDGYKEEYLVETGLSIKGENGVFDRFAGRVMFPIHSLAGKVIGFGGRVLKVDKSKNVGKYVNSPESEIYHKSKVLYGVYQAKNSIVRNRKCYLVEGYTDVISMHQAGIENVVASSGTALTGEQIQLIKRFTENVTVMYDGDAAGIHASLRGINMFLQEGINVKALLLPDGDDPDSFSRKHSATELEEYFAQHETDFIRFKAQLLLDDTKGDPIKRAEMINDVMESLSLIPDPIKRAVYLKEAAEMFEMEERMLTATADKMQQKRAADGQRRRTASQPTPEMQSGAEGVPPPASEQPLIDAEQQKAQEMARAEREIIRLLVNYGNEKLFDRNEETGEEELSVAAYLINEIRADEIELQHPETKAIFEEYEQIWQSEGRMNENHFIRHSNPAISQLTAELLTSKYELSVIYQKKGMEIKNEEEKLKDVVPMNLMAFKQKTVMRLLKNLSGEMQEALLKGDTAQYETLFTQFTALTEVKKQLAKTLGKRTL
ncbi:MAG: DNA primase [Bacteroidales bacterium]|jgi:DNA primase|nr:DNA primase [Bacteroidales bacterium]